MKQLHMDLGRDSYDILMEHRLLASAGKHLDLDRKVLIVTDDGVPEQYAEQLAAQCRLPVVVRVAQGEGAKSFPVFQRLLAEMLHHNFGRRDCVAALGGGVMGDLAGFVAASYMRGVDFYNIPTTTLSQVDSSIGGKVAINFEGVKNSIGAFYQPKRVLIDPDTLQTQNRRQLVNGLAEAIKAGLIRDAALFELFEQQDALAQLDEVIWRSLLVKQYVVEHDEKEEDLRKTLNFGHTLGHGIESAVGLGSLLHGECVGLGMLAIAEEPLRGRIAAVLEKYGLPTTAEYEKETAFSAVCHDKKGNGETTAIVKVRAPGRCTLETVPTADLKAML